MYNFTELNPFFFLQNHRLPSQFEDFSGERAADIEGGELPIHQRPEFRLYVSLEAEKGRQRTTSTLRRRKGSSCGRRCNNCKL